MAQDLSRQGYIVFVSCHEPVRKYLIENHGTENICLIYPSPELKEDWLKRLKLRYEASGLAKDEAAYKFALNTYDNSIGLLKAEAECGCYNAVIELDCIVYSLNDLILKIIREIGS